MRLNDAHMLNDQEAMGFLVSQTAYIESQVYEIQYPDIQYPNIIPVDTSAPEWINAITFFSVDKVGEADWFSHLAKDVPIADVFRAKHDETVEMAAIGYRYTLQELGVAARLGIQLTPDRAAAARRAYEEFVDRFALVGDTRKNKTGITNNPLVTVIDVPNGATGQADWSTKTADEIAADVNLILTGIYTESLTVEIADTLLLPIAMLLYISNKRMGPDTSMTLLTWLTQNNAYTAVTGRPLTIRGLRGLEDAGSGGSGRMIAYRRSPEVLKMHIPMPHQFLEVWRTGPLVYDVPGIFRLGGVEIRRPKAVRYADDIMNSST
jgi:hypothetical protein